MDGFAGSIRSWSFRQTDGEQAHCTMGKQVEHAQNDQVSWLNKDELNSARLMYLVKLTLVTGR